MKKSTCLLLRYGSRFIVKYTKAAKAGEVKPQIKIVIVQQTLHSVRDLPYLLREPANFAPDRF